MDVPAAEASTGAAPGTKHRQGGRLSLLKFNLRQLLDLPTPAPTAPDRAPSVSTTAPRVAPVHDKHRLALPDANPSHRRPAFGSSTKAPRAALDTTRKVPDLPRPIVEYGAHPVDQSTTAPVPRGAVTLLEADVDTTPARTERAAAAPHEFRDNRNIASTTATLRDELPTGLRMPLSSIIAKKPPTKTFFDQEGTRRETGEFVRR
jgi:hypothetical protein